VGVVTWPLHQLVLSTPSVVLRGMTEADAFALAAVVPEDLEQSPRLPDATAPRKVLMSYWRQMGQWLPTDWVLPFTVLVAGVPVGLQALEGKDFRVLRTVDTHSWLVPSVRGRGVGKQMRAMVLALAFEHLGAAFAITEAWDDNAASLSVSRALGYTDNGVELHCRDGGVGRMQRLLLPAETWTRPVQVEVSGLAPCRPLLGL
jgi:RimJ/RimL family protein N-acetyltransferase